MYYSDHPRTDHRKVSFEGYEDCYSTMIERSRTKAIKFSSWYNWKASEAVSQLDSCMRQGLWVSRRSVTMDTTGDNGKAPRFGLEVIISPHEGYIQASLLFTLSTDGASWYRVLYNNRGSRECPRCNSKWERWDKYVRSSPCPFPFLNREHLVSHLLVTIIEYFSHKHH